MIKIKNIINSVITFGILPTVSAHDLYGHINNDTQKEQIRPLNEVLRDAMIAAGAEYLCDKEIENKNKDRFIKMYGSRIERLRIQYESWHGKDDPLYQLASCRNIVNFRKFSSQSKKYQDNFAHDLIVLEKIYSRKPD